MGEFKGAFMRRSKVVLQRRPKKETLRRAHQVRALGQHPKKEKKKRTKLVVATAFVRLTLVTGSNTTHTWLPRINNNHCFESHFRREPKQDVPFGHDKSSEPLVNLLLCRCVLMEFTNICFAWDGREVLQCSIII